MGSGLAIKQQGLFAAGSMQIGDEQLIITHIAPGMRKAEGQVSGELVFEALHLIGGYVEHQQ